MALEKTTNTEQSAAKFERIRRAHQSEIAEDYVEMIAELIDQTGEARAVDLAQRFGVTAPDCQRHDTTPAKRGAGGDAALPVHLLTQAGRELANACRQRHQLVRDFLVHIGVEAEIAEEDAEGAGTSCQRGNAGCLSKGSVRSRLKYCPLSARAAFCCDKTVSAGCGGH